MHQTVNNVLLTLVHTNPPQNMASARDINDDALATVIHAIQTIVAISLGSALGSIPIARDMFLHILLIADWQCFARLCKHHVYENLHRANRKHHQFDYALWQ